MIRLKFIFVILFIAPIFLKGQLICIDSSTLKNANIYLIKGAKAREENKLFKAQYKLDSFLIKKQDKIIDSLNTNLVIVKSENTKVYKIAKYSILLNIILVLWSIL